MRLDGRDWETGRRALGGRPGVGGDEEVLGAQVDPARASFPEEHLLAVGGDQARRPTPVLGVGPAAHPDFAPLHHGRDGREAAANFDDRSRWFHHASNIALIATSVKPNLAIFGPIPSLRNPQ